MSGLVERHFNNAEPVDLAALWKDLGISLVAGRIALDDSAPSAQWRKMIVPGTPSAQARQAALGELSGRQNIPLLFAGFSGIGCTTSQCSTILPFSSRKMSTMATPRSPGSRTPWTCRIT